MNRATPSRLRPLKKVLTRGLIVAGGVAGAIVIALIIADATEPYGTPEPA